MGSLIQLLLWRLNVLLIFLQIDRPNGTSRRVAAVFE